MSPVESRAGIINGEDKVREPGFSQVRKSVSAFKAHPNVTWRAVFSGAGG